MYLGTVESKWGGGQIVEAWLEERKARGKPRKTNMNCRGGSRINGAEVTELRKIVGDRRDCEDGSRGFRRYEI